jgi:hypothetical protein
VGLWTASMRLNSWQLLCLLLLVVLVGRQVLAWWQ